MRHHPAGDGNGSRARAPTALSPELRASIGLVVVRAAAVIAPVGAVAISPIAVRNAEPAYIGLACLSGLVGAIAVYQLVAGRPRPLFLNLLSATGLAVISVFVPHAVAIGLGTGIVVLILAGIPLIPPARAPAYLGYMSLPWVGHLIWTHTVPGGSSPDALVSHLAQAVFLLFGIISVLAMRRHLGRGEARYGRLFSGAPIALREIDFSGVEPWFQSLRSRGIEDLRGHLKSHPAELRTAIGLLVTTDANPAAAAMMGAAAPDELLGPFRPGVLDDEIAALFLEQFVVMWEGAEAGDLEFTGRRVDGSHFQGVLHWSNPMTDGGRPDRVVTAVSDITGLRRVESQLEATATTARALVDALPDLLFLHDADGTYLEYHAADRTGLTDYTSGSDDLYVTPEEFLGKKPEEVLPPAVATAIHIAIATALETGHLHTLEYELPIGSQERHWEMRVTPLDGRAQVLALVRDVTARTEAARELVRLVQAKDDFIAAISHELRTPLTGIIGFAEILRSEASALPVEERRQIIETVVEQSTDLANIVEDLLVAAKADLGRLHIAAVSTDLQAQTNQVLEGWDPREVEKIEVSGEPVRCSGDPSRVRQIIRNLLANALRYGGERIRLTIGPGSGRGRLVVADNGSGLPPGEVEAAFLPYHRSAPADGLTSGLGLGLPISRNLARLMGGDLTYAREDGESRFELTLPLLEPESRITAGRGKETVGILGRCSPR